MWQWICGGAIFGALHGILWVVVGLYVLSEGERNFAYGFFPSLIFVAVIGGLFGAAVGAISSKHGYVPTSAVWALSAILPLLYASLAMTVRHGPGD